MPTTANLKQEISSLTNDGKTILVEFSKNIFENIFHRNRLFLKENSDVIVFNKNTWDYNPQLFCLDHYDLMQLYPVVLLINNLKSIFEFESTNLDNKILAPRLSSLISILVLPRIPI